MQVGDGYMPASSWWGAALLGYGVTTVIVYALHGIPHADLILDIQAFLLSAFVALCILSISVLIQYYQNSKNLKNIEAIVQRDLAQFDFKLSGEFQLGERLYEGNFSEIHAATYNGERVAVRSLRNIPDDEDQDVSHSAGRSAADFQEEIRMVATVDKHPNILYFYGALIYNDVQYIVMQRMKGSLDRCLRALNSSVKKVHAIYQIASGLAHLHGQPGGGIIHRDIKSSNVLVDDQGNLKISDFETAIAGHKVNNVQVVEEYAGTPQWSAPEVSPERGSKQEGYQYSKESDIYAFGMLMWEVAAESSQPSKNPEDIPQSCDTRFRTLITQCWSVGPEERPSARAIEQQLRNMRQP